MTAGGEVNAERPCGKNNGHCMLDCSEDEAFESSSKKPTVRKGGGDTERMKCSKNNGHYIPDHISDDDASERTQQASTKIPNASAKGERKCGKNNGHCTPNHLCDDPFTNNSRPQEGKTEDRTELLLVYGYELWEHNQLIPQEIILRAYPMHLRCSAQNNKFPC
jgi:hypothetical protein